ncbi:MAG TPA: hypothetical protein VE913_02185 [Longimicrobium sp.]|nr:hypothetical protein [Longimicrobium sp.]
MEPQDNLKIGLQKAISAHELAQSALADLPHDARFTAMVQRLEQNVAELRAESSTTSPAAGTA